MLFALLLIFLPLVLQQVGFFLVKTNLPVRILIFGAVCLLGLYIPWQATMMAASALVQSLNARGEEATCVTGAVVFLPLGYGVTLITFCVGLYSLFTNGRRKGMALEK